MLEVIFCCIICLNIAKAKLQLINVHSKLIIIELSITKILVRPTGYYIPNKTPSALVFFEDGLLSRNNQPKFWGKKASKR